MVFKRLGNYGHKVIVCETNLKMALELVNNGLEACHPYLPLIRKIRDLLAFDWNVRSQYTLVWMTDLKISKKFKCITF